MSPWVLYTTGSSGHGSGNVFVFLSFGVDTDTLGFRLLTFSASLISLPVLVVVVFVSSYSQATSAPPSPIGRDAAISCPARLASCFRTQFLNFPSAGTPSTAPTNANQIA